MTFIYIRRYEKQNNPPQLAKRILFPEFDERTTFPPQLRFPSHSFATSVATSSRTSKTLSGFH